jgi:phospholipid/cholesterol/gamma-HCH transport system substrate-binding protein
VKYLGVPAGVVKDIRFEENHFPNVQVTMEIAEHIPITASTRATLAIGTLTGRAHIELTGGEIGESFVADGGRIPSEPSSFEKLTESLPLIAERLPRLMSEMEAASESVRAFFSVEAEHGLAASLDELEAVARDLGQTAGSELERTAGELRQVAARLEARTDEMLAAVRDTAVSWNADLENIGSLPERLGATLVQLESLLRRAELALDAQTLASLQRGLEEASLLLQELRRDPGALFFSPAPIERAVPEPRAEAPSRRP